MKKLYILIILSFLILLPGCSLNNQNKIEVEDIVGKWNWKGNIEEKIVEFTKDGKLYYNFIFNRNVENSLSCEFDYELITGESGKSYIYTHRIDEEDCNNHVPEYGDIDIIDGNLYFPGLHSLDLGNIFEKS